MRKLAQYMFGLILAPILLLPGNSLGSELPTILNCKQNAAATRDFGFLEKKWMAGASDKGKTFEIAERDPSLGRPFYDHVFTALDTESPVIRSTRLVPIKGRFEETSTAEFRGTVVSRTGDAVFFTWRNPPMNKVWLAALDLTHRKATVGYVFQGITSVGVQAQTLDCR